MDPRVPSHLFLTDYLDKENVSRRRNVDAAAAHPVPAFDFDDAKSPDLRWLSAQREPRGLGMIHLVDDHPVVFHDGGVGELLRALENVFPDRGSLQLDGGRVLAEMNRDGPQPARPEQGLGQDVLAGVLRHEITAPGCVHDPTDRPLQRVARGRIHHVHNVLFLLLHVNNAGTAEHAPVCRLASAAREEARAIKHHLMQRAVHPVTDDGGVELKEGGIMIEELFGHGYRVSVFCSP